MMGQITEDFVQRAMRCCQLGQHPSLTVWETRQLLTAWVEWQGCRDERDKLDEANRICEQWRQWTVATRAENEALRARVEQYQRALEVLYTDESGDLDYIKWYITEKVLTIEAHNAIDAAGLSGNKPPQRKEGE